MPTRRYKREPTPPEPTPSKGQLCAAIKTKDSETNLIPGCENKSQLNEIFKQASRWATANMFINRVVRLRTAFYNFGLDLVPLSGKPDEKDKLKEWTADRKNKRLLRDMTRDVWREYLIQRNVIAVWRKSSKRPVFWKPWECDYKDELGIERLVLNLALSEEARRDIIKELTSEERTEFIRNPTILKLTHASEAFGFSVLKEESLGNGLGFPELYSIFQEARQFESMQVGDNQRGDTWRDIYEQHQMGHEIKAGFHSGSKAHFINAKRVTDFTNAIKGKKGRIRMPTNFDHKILFPGLDPAVFEWKKFQGVVERMMLWAMPLGQMVISRSLNPYLLPVLKTDALNEREDVAPLLDELLNDVVKPSGIPCRVKWSNACFKDPKVAAQILTNGVNGGMTSQETWQLDNDLDPEKERALKLKEAALPKSQTTPIYDSSHGPVKESGGRNRGTPDGGGQ